MPNCIAMGSVTPCSPQLRKFFECLLDQPLKNWACDEGGVAAIREGFCDAEQQGAISCMQEKMRQ